MAKKCVPQDVFVQWLVKLDETKELDKQSKELRVKVWEFDAEKVRSVLFGGINVVENTVASDPVKNKIRNFLRGLDYKEIKNDSFKEKVVLSDQLIPMSIALHEVFESIKGESDKVLNEGLTIERVSNSPKKELPNLPTARVAESIGRKIVYQKGFVFSGKNNPDVTSQEISKRYYDIGMSILNMLKNKGYVELYKAGEANTIKDYVDKTKGEKEVIRERGVVVSDMPAVALNLSAFTKEGADFTSEEVSYFTDRANSLVASSSNGGSVLNRIINTLNIVSNLTQPQNISLPLTTEPTQEILDNDTEYDPGLVLKNTKDFVGKTPIKLNNVLHNFLKNLSTKVDTSVGKSASTYLASIIPAKSGLMESLFDIKRSDQYAKDRKQSVNGQNISRTSPLNDLVENYMEINPEGDSKLYMPLTTGRNSRLYLLNSILDYHGSKHSRYMLTSGSHDSEVDSDMYKRVVSQVANSLGVSPDAIMDLSTPGLNSSVTKETLTAEKIKLKKALKSLEMFSAEDVKLKIQVKQLANISSNFPGIDFASLLTGFQAVSDIRNPVNGIVSTEYMVSADATASGGTLTFLQAVGTSANVIELLADLRILDRDSPEAQAQLNDIYGIMEKSIDDFINDIVPDNMRTDVASEIGTNNKARRLLTKLNNVLYTDKNKRRGFAKAPTLTFIYGQGEFSSIEVLSEQIAQDIQNNLSDPKIIELIIDMLSGTEIAKQMESGTPATEIEGLYAALVNNVVESKVPQKLYSLMKEDILDKYLEEYTDRTAALFQLMNDTQKNYFRMLPAHTVLMNSRKGTEKIEMTPKNLQQYGVPISKIQDVAIEVDGEKILTRNQIKAVTVMNVSTIHSIDTAQMYAAINDVLVSEGIPQGLMIIHDDVRSTPKTVALIEKAYIKVTKELAVEFDVHDQILKSIATYSPELVGTKSYEKLRKSIDKSMAIKKETMESFNFDTKSIIGDFVAESIANKLDDDIKIASENNVKIEQEVKAKAKAKSELKSFDQMSAQDVVESFKGTSKVIDMFLSLGDKVRPNLVKEDLNTFLPATDTIAISAVDNRFAKDVKKNIKTESGNKAIKQLVEHEIIHSFTVGYVERALRSKKQDLRVAYLSKAITSLSKLKMSTKLTNKTKDRLNYIVANTDESTRINEFIAIMSTEPKVAKEIYGILAGSKSRVQAAIDYIKKQVNRILENVTVFDLYSKDIDIVKVRDSVNGIIQDGFNYREAAYDSFNENQIKFDGPLNAGRFNYETVSEAKGYTLNYLNQAVASMVTTKIEKGVVKLARSTDRLFKINFPAYARASEKLQGIYDSSDALQELVHTVTNFNIDKNKKNYLLSIFSKLRADNNSLMAEELSKFNKITKSMPKQQKENLFDFITKTPLHDYFILADKIVTAEDFDTRIAELEGKLHKNQVDAVDKIVYMRTVYEKDGVDGTAFIKKGTDYNLYRNNPAKSEDNDKSKELLALKSIKALGVDNFIELLNNTKLMNLVKDNSIANRLALLANGDGVSVNDSLIADKYAEPMEKRVIPLASLKNYDSSDKKGWKILRMPTQDTLGIVYRPVIDSTYLQGIYTDIKLASGDITVDKSYRGQKNVVPTANGYKLVLKDHEKETLGLIKDPAESLVRSAAHSLAVQDSQIIRDTLLMKETRMVINDKSDEKELVSIFSSENIDNPWFLKIDNDNFINLDPKIKAKYKRVDKSMSDVKSFDKEVDLVRKDIAYWLIGGVQSSLSENPKLRWMMRLTKSVVASSKISMVILNPVKIAKDNMSNISYLTVMGLNPLNIQKDYRIIAKEYKDYTDIKDKIINLRIVQGANNGDTATKQKIIALQEELAAHPADGVFRRGFVNSLGTDLIHQNADTISGMQSDVQTALSYLLKDSRGDNNFLARYIRDLSRLGGNGEDLLSYFGSIIGRADSLKGAQKELDKAAARIKEIKSDADVVNYVSQFMITPNSESVKLGSYATDLTDVLAKETYYRYLVTEKKLSDKEAEVQVIEAFPDYKENLPMAIKQLSDTGILLFPAFWLRIQKVIYRMLRDKPVNLGIEIQIQNMTGLDAQSILDSNIYNKATDFNGLINSPLDRFEWGALFPTNAI